MYRKLFLSLNRETTLITANKRLAIYLQELNYPKNQHAIYDIQSWILAMGSHYQQPSTRILSESEENYLWQKIIAQSLEEHPLLNLTATAQLAGQAWQHLKLWDKSFLDLKDRANPEFMIFKQWAEAFERYKQQGNYLSLLDLPGLLLKSAEPIKLSTPILLLGFDEIPPVYQRLFNSLKDSVEIREFIPEKILNQPSRVSAANTQEEIRLMARWAKNLVEQNPKMNIGCIVPKLSHLEKNIRSIFTEVFEAENELSLHPDEFEFNISAGQALIQFELIETALNLLDLDSKHVELESFSNLIRSPYLHSNLADNFLNHELDLELRTKTRGTLIKLPELNALIGPLNETYPEASFPEHWKNFYALLNNNKKPQAPSEWVKLFKLKLEAIAWPGGRKLNAEETALVEAWEKLLETCSNLDDLSGALTKNQAAKSLRHLAETCLFQTKIKPSSIQILGALEASSLDFDALWIMGLSDQDWPSPAEPNPFIPYYQQRQWNMPHASTEREFNYTQKLQTRLLNNAEQIILSHADYEKEIRLSPSPLIKHFPKISIKTLEESWQLKDYRSKAHKIYDSRQLESLEDNQAPTLSQEKIRGGSFILKEQALCPFKAFAGIRLNAFSLPAVELGLSAMEKGILVHQALELFWKKIKTQSQLLKLSADELSVEIEKVVFQCLKNKRFNESLLSVEKSRLKNLLSEWLEIEKQRPPFKVIATEANYLAKVAELKLDLRIDRIDELEEGCYLIIDYKTGKSQFGSWFEERITEPQLPLYASFAFTEAEAIAFAQIKNGNIKFTGISLDETNLKGIIPLNKLKSKLELRSWEELTQIWKTNLEKLAHDFYNGIAAVDPADTTSCNQCDLQALCRINHSKGVVEEYS